MTYYSKRIQSKISKGKRHMGQSLEETRCKFSRVFIQWSDTGYVSFPQQQFVTTCMKCHLPGNLPRVSGPGVVIRVWLWRHPVPGTYQNSRLLEGKLVFSANHIVCTNCLGSMSHSYQGGGKLHKIQLPRCQPWANLIRIAARPALFCALSKGSRPLYDINKVKNVTFM